MDEINIHIGDNGPQVVKLQQMLKKLSYPLSTSTNTFDQETARALQAFQNDHRLRSDGKVNAETWIALEKATGTEDNNIPDPMEAAPTAALPSPSVIPNPPLPSMVQPIAQPVTPVLRQSDRGESVGKLQDALNMLGYLRRATDGIFGNATTGAVRTFQTEHGLDADGIAGPKTWAALENALEDQAATGAKPTLRKGDSGPVVVEAQHYLKDLGFYDGNADGSFGNKTIDAVREFQQYAGITTDGIIGPVTWSALDDDLSADATPATQSPEAAPQQKILSAIPNIPSAVQEYAADSKEPMPLFTKAAPSPDHTHPLEKSQPIIRLGDAGQPVSDLQTHLEALKLYSGHISGIFDQETEAAVKSFQSSNYLTADGIVGRSTRDILDTYL